MRSQPQPRTYTRVAAAIVIAAIIIAAILFVTLGSSTTFTKTVSETTTTTKTNTLTSLPSNTSTNSASRTCTDIPAISYLYCGSPLRISAYGEPGAGPGVSSTQGSWNFTVSISSNSVTQGQTILLVANLTNIGPNITINQFVKPYINPGVYATNGTEVWAWNPSQSTWSNETIVSGETISQDVNIPTSQLLAGQSYTIIVSPISVHFPTPNNLTFTFQFSVR